MKKNLTVLLCVFVLSVWCLPLAANPGSFIGRCLTRTSKVGLSRVARAGAGRSVTRLATKAAVHYADDAARVAGKSFGSNLSSKVLKELTPGVIVAGGAATAMVVAGHGTAEAAQEIASSTSNAININARAASQLIDGSAPSTKNFFEWARLVLKDITTILAILFLAVFIMIGWRYGLMPWQAVARVERVVVAKKTDGHCDVQVSDPR